MLPVFIVLIGAGSSDEGDNGNDSQENILCFTIKPTEHHWFDKYLGDCSHPCYAVTGSQNNDCY